MISGLSAYNRGDYITAFRTADFCGAVSSEEPFFETTIESRGAVNGAAGVPASPVPVTEEELGDVAAACDPRPPIKPKRRHDPGLRRQARAIASPIFNEERRRPF